MKKLLIVLGLILSFQGLVYAEVQQAQVSTVLKVSDVTAFTNEDKLWGLKDKSGNIIVEPEYLKLIRVGDSSWIVQKKNKFGLMDSSGNFLVKPKYRHVDRILGKYVKLGNDNDFALYDEYGNAILPHEYMSIDLLFGGMFLTYKNYKYGVVDFNGKVLISNICDDIYMPKPNIMRVKYNGEWYEIEQVNADTLTLPEDVAHIKENENFKVTNLLVNTGVGAGYSVLTFSDYFIKIFSSISPAHEATIDDLMLSRGADTVSILMKFGWLPMYPVTFVRKYYENIRNPLNGPLSDVREDLKKQIK